MSVWKVIIEADTPYSNSSRFIYLGTASSAKVAMNQTMRLAKKEMWRNRKIVSVERLGELDFFTR